MQMVVDLFVFVIRTYRLFPLCRLHSLENKITIGYLDNATQQDLKFAQEQH